MSRLKEPSTWAGIAAILQALKLAVPAGYQGAVDAVSAVAGGVAVALREQGSAP